MKTTNEQRLDATHMEIKVKLIEKYSTNKSTQTVLLFANDKKEIPSKDYSAVLNSYDAKANQIIKEVNK